MHLNTQICVCILYMCIPNQHTQPQVFYGKNAIQTYKFLWVGNLCKPLFICHCFWEGGVPIDIDFFPVHTCTLDITCFIINISVFTTFTVLSLLLFIFRSFGIGLSSGSLARQAPSLEAHQQGFQVLQTLADNLLLGMEVFINIGLPEFRGFA